MKKFDVEAALRGEPCISRGGDKIHIVHRRQDSKENVKPSMKPLMKPLIGYIEGWEDSYTWDLDGSFLEFETHLFDIVGMWDDHPETQRFLGELRWKRPAQKMEVGETYFYVDSTFKIAEATCYDSHEDHRRWNYGNYFLIDTDAKTFQEALERMVRNAN